MSASNCTKGFPILLKVEKAEKNDCRRLSLTRTHWWDDTVALALPEGDFAVCLDHDVACLSSSLGAHDALNGHDLSLKWSLVVVGVQGHFALFQLQGDATACNGGSGCSMSKHTRAHRPGNDGLPARNLRRRRIRRCERTIAGATTAAKLHILTVRVATGERAICNLKKC